MNELVIIHTKIILDEKHSVHVVAIFTPKLSKQLEIKLHLATIATSGQRLSGLDKCIRRLHPSPTFTKLARWFACAGRPAAPEFASPAGTAAQMAKVAAVLRREANW